MRSSKVLLRDLISFSRDGEWGRAEPNLTSVTMRVIRGTDFAAARGGDLNGTPVRQIAAKSALKKALQANDILIETAGGTQTRPTGRCMIVRQRLLDTSDLPLICASFSRFVRIDPTKAHPPFIFWYLDYAYRADLLRKFNTQHTGVARFQWSICSETFYLVLPMAHLQKKIAAVLDAFDELIENNRRRIKILQETAQSLYREWFIHHRFPGHEFARLVESPLGVIPGGWTYTELRKIATVNPASANPSGWRELRYLDISAVGVRTLAWPVAIRGGEAPGRARHLVADGDIVHAMVRPNRRAHGLVVDPPADGIASTGLAVIRAKCVPPSFLFELVSNQVFTDYLVGRSTGAAYPAVRPKDFEEAPIVRPTDLVLREFDALIGPVQRASASLSAQSHVLGAARDLLLPRLVTGQVEVDSLGIDDVFGWAELAEESVG